EPQQCAPYNRRRRFGKAIWRFLRFARALRLVERRYKVWLFSEQQSLRSHGDSAEVTTAITNRFPDQYQFFFSQPLLQISAQLFAPDRWSTRADVVLLIDFPPWIEHSAGGRSF